MFETNNIFKNYTGISKNLNGLKKNDYGLGILVTALFKIKTSTGI